MYCDLIAELGRRNSESLAWWATSLASKNFGDSPIWQNIWRFLDGKQTDESVPSLFVLFEGALKRLYRSRLLAPRRLRREANRRRIELASLDVLVVTHFDGRSFSGDDAAYTDWIWRNFINHLEERGERIAVVGMIQGDEAKVVERLTARIGEVATIVLPVDAFVGVGDVCWALWKTLFAKCPNLESGAVFQGRNIAPILLRQWQIERTNGHLFKNLLFYRIWLRVFKVTRPKRVVWPWEHHSWERMLMLAAAQTSPVPRTVGYQHSTIPPSLLNHFPGKAELSYAPFPDRIACTGPRARGELARFGSFPKGCLIDTCSVRYEDAWRMAVSKPRTPRLGEAMQIGVALSVELEVCKELLTIVCGLRDAGISYRYKAHPLLPESRLRALLGDLCPPMSDFVESVSVSDFCSQIDMLIYAKTTVGLESILHGVPSIHLSNPENESNDPIYWLEDFHWVAVSQHELNTCIQDFIGMKDQDRDKSHQQAVSKLKEFLKPPDDQLMNLLLTC